MANKIISRAEAVAQGLTRYYTGKTCRRGHIAERWVPSFACLVCASEDRKERRKNNPGKDLSCEAEYREQNRDKLRQQQSARHAMPGEARDRRLALRAAWREKNNERLRLAEAKRRAESPEKFRESSRRYVERNKEKDRARRRKYRKENPEIRQNWLEGGGRQKEREWREVNKEKLAAYFKQWIEENKDKKYSYIHKRRALKKQAEGTHTAAEVAAILVAQNYCCKYCDADLRVVEKHLDHIMPLSKVGSNDKSNIQWLCRLHNLQKSAKDPVEYEHSIGFVR